MEGLDRSNGAEFTGSSAAKIESAMAGVCCCFFCFVSGYSHFANLISILFKKPFLNTIQQMIMLCDFKIFGLRLKGFVRILSRLEWVSTGGWIHLRHLLSVLACGIIISKYEDEDRVQSE